MTELIIYPNFSKGGVSTVIRGRTIAHPESHFNALFSQDRGGGNIFDDLENVSASVYAKSRFAAAAKYIAARDRVERASILSFPAAVEMLHGRVGKLDYEFHSSNMKIISNEIDQIDFEKVDTVVAPSHYMADMIRQRLPRKYRDRLSVRPNLLDTKTFRPDGPSEFEYSQPPGGRDDGSVPLVWVGRFDADKGFRDFARLLSILPNRYVGYVVVSLEDSPERPSAFLNECAAYGVLDRVRLFRNLPGSDLATLYRWARNQGGWAISTSKLESFGYFIAETSACDLRVVAFDLPVLSEHINHGLIHSVAPGSVTDMAALLSEDTPTRF